MWILPVFTMVSLGLAGNTEKIQSKQLFVDSPIRETLFCGVKKTSILILTEEFKAYRSETTGFSWKILEFQSAPLENLAKILQSKADFSLIALLSKVGTHYYSEDCGKTIKLLNKTLFSQVLFHPTIKTWALASSFDECTDFDDEICGKYKVLYVTKDLGETWTAISTDIVQFSWGITGLDTDLIQEFPLESLFVTRKHIKSFEEIRIRWDYDIDFIRTDDFFESETVLVPHGNLFIISARFILVAAAVENSANEVKLLISNENSLGTFELAEFPMEDIPEHGYTLLDTSENSVFINVNHYGLMSKSGNIYKSDISGHRFSQSLLRNVRDRTGLCDFSKVEGIDGIYFANVHVENPETSSKPLQRTVVSYDKGREWSSIPAPSSISCLKNCFLHLHSVTSPYSSIYSKASALGIIIGIGNIGKHLLNNQDELSTFISRDAGFTWNQAKKGVFIYEIGDYGEVILMADSIKSTNFLYFSSDEGLTWDTWEMDFSMQVNTIEVQSASQKFLVFGEKDAKGVSFAVDFSEIFENICKNIDLPGNENSDYEVWGLGGCLMGHTIEYTRRKQKKQCFHGENFERPKKIENCLCSEKDYECDLGYFYNDRELCVGKPLYDVKTCENSEFSETPTGYRKVPGNTCIKGVQLAPDRSACPRSFGNVGTFILFLITCAIFFTGFRIFAEYFQSLERKNLEIPERAKLTEKDLDDKYA